jgi:hypothetical protein
MSHSPGFVPIAQAAGSMGLTVAEAMQHAVVIDGQTVVPQQTMYEVAAQRNKLAKEEHRRASIGEIAQSDRRF